MERDTHPLEQALADAREEAAVLRRAGHGQQAEHIEGLCAKVSVAAEDYLKKLSLTDAKMKSGLSERTLRRRFRDLVDCGLADTNTRGEMEFRSCAIPQRDAPAINRQRGREAARQRKVG